jgi:hypothetical protein
MVIAGTARAQGSNEGSVSVTAAFDVPSLYLFRGIRQEVDPGLTMWPYADLGLSFLSDGAGTLKSFGVNLGVWNSLNTGSSGSDGPGKLNYEEDFYAGFTMGFGAATSFSTTYTAYTSPNSAFTTVKEVSFKVAHGSTYAPYGLVAFEFDTDPGRGQADGGENGGTYLELGIGPSWSGDRASVTVPVKIGLSLNDYYELDGSDNAFGFFDIGALVSVPIAAIPERLGSWNFHFGGDYFLLGDTTEAFNVNKDGETSQHKLIGLVGFGVSY